MSTDAPGVIATVDIERADRLSDMGAPSPEQLSSGFAEAVAYLAPVAPLVPMARHLHPGRADAWTFAPRDS